MYLGFWFEFVILLCAAVFGSIAILPYSLRLLKGSEKIKPLRLPLWAILLLSILQNAILFAVVICLGLLASHQLKHGAPIIEAVYLGTVSNQLLGEVLLPAFMLGILAGIALFLADLIFLPYFPDTLLKTTLKTTQWENFLASFYGGINEELIMRLFGVSVIIWLALRFLHQSTDSIFWYANFFMAIIFAFGHLPTLKNLLGKISSPMLFRTIILNTPIGLLCGWIFWRYGIEAAIVTHFVADIVYHVGGTIVLRSKFKHR